MIRMTPLVAFVMRKVMVRDVCQSNEGLTTKFLIDVAGGWLTSVLHETSADIMNRMSNNFFIRKRICEC